MASDGLERASSVSPDDADAALVHQWRARAVHHKAYAHLSKRGRRTAWEATRALADLLVPSGGDDFLRVLSNAIKARSNGKWPTDRLFYACELEMVRQGRLGREALPVSIGDGLLSEDLG